MKKKFLDKILVSAVPALASLIIRLIKATMRTSYINFEGYRKMLDGGQQVILAFWHGRLLMMPYSYPGRKITILVSQSKDGELIARTMEKFGIESARGSTTRGALGGVKGLLKSVRGGRDLAITPDGPKGPNMKVQMGVIQLARMTGLPIIPLSFGASWKKSCGSWDSFLLPYPFSRGVFVCGDPVRVNPDASNEELEQARASLEKTLVELTRRADELASR